LKTISSKFTLEFSFIFFLYRRKRYNYIITISLLFPYARLIFLYASTYSHPLLLFVNSRKKNFSSFYCRSLSHSFSSRALVFVIDSNIPIFSLLRIICHTLLLKLSLSFLSDSISVSNAQSNEGTSRMQSISDLYLSLPIACPSFSRYAIYIGGIFIFLYKSYRTRVPDIRKYVNEQTMIESKKKRETNE